MKNNYERKDMTPDEIEFEKLKKACQRYGYKATFEFGTFYIKTKFESWKFEPSLTGLIRLYHKNSTIHLNQKNEWHRQFKRHMSYNQLVDYLNEHENSRYVDSMTPFTFTKGYVARQSVGM